MTGTTQERLESKDRLEPVWLRPRRLLIAAAVFHLLVTLSICALGRYAVLPGTFNPHGVAVSFAPDGEDFRDEAAGLGDILRSGQIREWFSAVSPLHLKLHSIFFALLSPWLGSTILNAEPLNSACYLALLILVYKIGQELFSERTALIAAVIIAFWPSFLLHTTQLLKDPLFLVGMLTFVLVNLRLLAVNLSWRRALLTGAVGGLIAALIWVARASMGELVIATVALGVVLLVLQQVREKHFHAPNVIGMVLMIVMSIGVTRVVPKFRVPDELRARYGTKQFHSVPSTNTDASLLNPLSRIAARIGTVRQRFIVEYPDASSNLDGDVQLTSAADLIRYLPRALAIGLFAPFPNMWFAAGNHVGSAGRRLSGLETLLMYLVEGLAIIGIWSGSRGRRRFSVWLLAMVAVMGMTSLGLVVVNMGALYRLRYIFVILLIILAAEGAARIFVGSRKAVRRAG